MFIYLHVPFCRSQCIYCDFYVVLEKYGGQQAFVEAVLQEIEARLTPCQGKLPPIETLYVGGGTPSLLPAAAYRRIFDALAAFSPWTEGAEITLEANPRALADPPEAYREAGFNRVSIGVQSLDDVLLKRLSRAHSARDAADCVRAFQQAGFDNVSIDLMYALPGQTPRTWAETLSGAVDLGVQHISMYGLKTEEGTPLAALQAHPVAAAVYGAPDEEANAAMYEQAVSALSQAGFERYEFSNLAREGRFRSRHNLNYWQNGFYWAFGPSAHGYVPAPDPAADPLRYEVIRDLSAYLAEPGRADERPCPPAEQLENALIFGLRTSDGVSVTAIERAYGIDFEAQYGAVLARHRDYLELRDGRLRLKPEAISVSNAILADFLA